MASVSIRDLDDGVRERLRVRAAEHGRSMEAEIRVILTDAVADPVAEVGLLGALIARVAEIGGADFELPERTELARAVDFS